jgi:ABC-type multidrug transport system fused ATPase/permease subunit
MAKSDSNSNRKNGFNWRLILPWVFVFILIIIVVWLILGVYSHLDRIENVANQTRELNKSFGAEIQEIETIGSQVYPGINILTKEDMQSLKKILFALKGEVDKAISLSHQDTINIVDRVNLYVTIGIVLLTLLGVFLPVIVQSFGREEIKELKEDLKKKAETLEEKIKKSEERLNEISTKIDAKGNEIEEFGNKIEKLEGEFKEELEEKTGMLDSEIKNADTELKGISSQVDKKGKEIEGFSRNIKSLKEKLEETEGRLDTRIANVNDTIHNQNEIIKKAQEDLGKIRDETKNIPPLKLSYALLRALDKNLIRWYSINQKKSYELLIGIFEDITATFKECKSEKIFPKDNFILKSGLFSFNQDLEYVIMMSQFKKKDIKDFKSLSNSINELIKNIDKKEETLFDPIIGDIDTLIKSFRKKKKEIEEKKQQYS